MKIEELENKLKDAKKDVLLKPLTSMRVGGRAKLFYEAVSQDELKNAVRLAWQNETPVLLLGEATNVVISDLGFPGLVIFNKSKDVMTGSKEVIADSGISLQLLIRQLLEKDLGGLEFLAGIPGTLGGAVYGNAGAFGKSISDVVSSVTILDIDEKVRALKLSQLDFSYRSSIFKKNQNKIEERKPIVLSATLKVIPSRKETIKRTISNFLKIRAKSQPKEPSCGCFFKNLLAVNYPHLPAQAKLAEIGGKISSGAILERVGAKEMSEGGIRVAKEHANYIVNSNRGTAYDIKKLSETLKKKVYSEFGVNLNEEVEFVGDFSTPPPRRIFKIFL